MQISSNPFFPFQFPKSKTKVTKKPKLVVWCCPWKKKKKKKRVKMNIESIKDFMDIHL